MRIYSKLLHYTALIFSIVLTLSCKIETRNQVLHGYTHPSLDSCKAEPDHHYFISLPDHLNSEQKIPLVIVIDPHGDGLSAMQRFREALADLTVIIAGSSKLRNNYAGFEFSLENLKNDLLSKYPVDPQKIIVAGFSGGARMAMYYGMKNPVHGIIMFGAGPGNLIDRFKEKQIYAVSGTRDFNFIEQYRPLFIDIRDDPGYINDFFRGMHTWPPERYIRESVAFCLRDESAVYQSLSLELSEDFLKESDSLQYANDLLFAGKALEKARYFSNGYRQKQLSAKIQAFESNPAWIAHQQKIETLLRSEVKMKLIYSENLADPDTLWWSKELNSLANQINACPDPDEKDYCYRLKGFLGIYLYSQINTLLKNNGSGDLLDRLIWIYERVEPDSQDLLRFKVELIRIRTLR